MYSIIWKGEEIDTADTIKDRDYLVAEYNLAYKGGVTWRKI